MIKDKLTKADVWIGNFIPKQSIIISDKIKVIETDSYTKTSDKKEEN